jgi:hypothetical protein
MKLLGTKTSTALEDIVISECFTNLPKSSESQMSLFFGIGANLRLIRESGLNNETFTEVERLSSQHERLKNNKDFQLHLNKLRNQLENVELARAIFEIESLLT